jgi:hypothetical protein
VGCHTPGKLRRQSLKKKETLLESFLISENKKSKFSLFLSGCINRIARQLPQDFCSISALCLQ